MRVEMFVRLLIPDSIAVTAFNTLKKLGYDKLKSLKRMDYYCFEVEDEEGFKEKISKVDLLVNANKHSCSFSLDSKDIKVLVREIDDRNGLLAVLKNRLGFSNIKSIEKGSLWLMDIDGDGKEYAERISKELLFNEHYQEMRFIQ